jgi:hypothetical protein
MDYLSLLDSVTRVAATNYTPTTQDILCTKIRTTGVVELQFIHDGVKFKYVGMGVKENCVVILKKEY